MVGEVKTEGPHDTSYPSLGGYCHQWGEEGGTYKGFLSFAASKL